MYPFCTERQCHLNNRSIWIRLNKYATPGPVLPRRAGISTINHVLRVGLLVILKIKPAVIRFENVNEPLYTLHLSTYNSKHQPQRHLETSPSYDLKIILGDFIFQVCSGDTSALIDITSLSLHVEWCDSLYVWSSVQTFRQISMGIIIPERSAIARRVYRETHSQWTDFSKIWFSTMSSKYICTEVIHWLRLASKWSIRWCKVRTVQYHVKRGLSGRCCPVECIASYISIPTHWT